MNIYLFGRTTLSGEAFIEQADKNISNKIYSFSRIKNLSNRYTDLKNPDSFDLVDNQEFLIVSFAPIWELSYFLSYLFKFQKYKLSHLKGIIACSSTSALTKRFESNLFDRNLSKNLINSEKNIIKISERLGINCQIIRPTLIYGSINNMKDKNISKIITIMRIFKLILIPSNSGTRQPIHAYQLSEVIHTLIKSYPEKMNKSQRNLLSVGGDVILSYEEMLRALKSSLNPNDNAKNCLILVIPKRIYFIFILPVMFFSPKMFASLSRICSDLSGFTMACQITKSIPKDFPMFKISQ